LRVSMEADARIEDAACLERLYCNSIYVSR
jgi:hypothetical protein